MSALTVENLIVAWRADPDYARNIKDPLLIYLGSTSEGGGEKAAFNTMGLDPSGDPSLMEPLNYRDVEVLFVRKQPNKAYPDRISVGRTRVSDLHISLPQISKMHAYFVAGAAPGTFALVDAGSTNGTTVGGTRVQAGVPTPLGPTCCVTFGPYRFVYCVPERLDEIMPLLAGNRVDELVDLCNT